MTDDNGAVLVASKTYAALTDKERGTADAGRQAGAVDGDLSVEAIARLADSGPNDGAGARGRAHA